MKFSRASTSVRILKFSKVSETDSVPETLENFNILTRLLARENFIQFHFNITWSKYLHRMDEDQNKFLNWTLSMDLLTKFQRNPLSALCNKTAHGRLKWHLLTLLSLYGTLCNVLRGKININVSGPRRLSALSDRDTWRHMSDKIYSWNEITTCRRSFVQRPDVVVQWVFRDEYVYGSYF
jgi:hypothetical protein